MANNIVIFHKRIQNHSHFSLVQYDSWIVLSSSSYHFVLYFSFTRIKTPWTSTLYLKYNCTNILVKPFVWSDPSLLQYSTKVSKFKAWIRNFENIFIAQLAANLYSFAFLSFLAFSSSSCSAFRSASAFRWAANSASSIFSYDIFEPSWMAFLNNFSDILWRKSVKTFSTTTIWLTTKLLDQTSQFNPVATVRRFQYSKNIVFRWNSPTFNLSTTDMFYVPLKPKSVDPLLRFLVY